MKRWFATLVLAAGTVSGGAAHAACRLTQVTVPGVSVSYDPFDDTFTPSPVTLAFQTEGDCSGARIEIALAPTPVSPQTGGIARLKNGAGSLGATVVIGGQPREIVAQGAGMSTNPLSLPIGATGQVLGDATVALSLEQGQVAPPGHYSATLDLRVRLSGSTSKQPTLSNDLNLSVDVSPSVRLATGSGDLAIDLGELKSGSVGGPVNFDAYANVDYSLIMRSENAFMLRRAGAMTAPGVPYTPMISNGAVGATTGPNAATVRQALFNAPGDGTRHHALRVKIEPFPSLAAGHYSDVLTLEIRARV